MSLEFDILTSCAFSGIDSESSAQIPSSILTSNRTDLNEAKIVNCVYNSLLRIHKEIDPLECENPLSCLFTFCFACIRIG